MAAILRRLALAFLLATVGCNSGPTNVSDLATPSPAVPVHVANLGQPGCAPGASFHGWPDATGFQETGVDSSAGSLWALVFVVLRDMPPRAGKDIKIVWRMTGTGDFGFRALDEKGDAIAPLGTPQPHGDNGSNWLHPGYEMGTGFNFPHPGCWDIHVTRSDVEGDLWLEVAA
jgi:hypothetical protein